MIRKFKRWIDSFYEQAVTVPGCDNEDKIKVDALEQKEERSENKHAHSSDVSGDDEIRATAVPSCYSEESVKDDEEAKNVDKLTCNGSDQSAACNDGKPSNAETQGACQGAAASVKGVPDYPLFPLSRGFCLSLTRALESFQAALEKAQLPDCSE